MGSLLLAFVILFISSANILVALLALVNIAGIIASILGMMVALGWELDSIESICLTILFSLLWALGFFMAAMATCGPQGNCGSILCLRRLLGHVVVDDAVEVTPTDNTNTKTGDL